MFRKILAVSAFSLALSSCATNAVMTEVLNSWEGATLAEVTRAWGQPDEQFTQGDNRVLIWKNDIPEYRELSRVSTTKYNIFKGVSHETRSAGDMVVRKTCDRMLTISPQNVVIGGGQWRGTNCPAFRAVDYNQWRRS